MKNFKFYSVFLLINFLLITVAFGQQDEEGGQDYPIFPRIEGFYITGYQNGDFLVGGKPQGYKFQINYELKNGAETSLTDTQIVQSLVKKAGKLGAKILTNDGYAATLSLRHKGENLWIQLGAFGPSYELIVVEKGSKGASKAIHGDTPIISKEHKVQTLAKIQQITITSNGVVSGIDKTRQSGLVLNANSNTTYTKSNGNSNYRFQNDVQNSHDYWLFPRFENYYIRDYEDIDFVVDNKVEGRKFRINYELQKGVKGPGEGVIIKNYSDRVSKEGGKILTNDGYAVTMELKKYNKDLWMQVGDFGNGYEVIVVEKGNTRVQTIAQNTQNQPKNTTTTQNTNRIKQPPAEIDVASSHDYPLFNRLDNYYIRDYEETDFVVGTKVEGYKYRINYELKEGINAPTDKQVVRNHIGKLKAAGGKVLTNDGYASTMELKKNGKNLWIQIGSFGNGYEVIVVEKGNIRPEALRKGNIRKPQTIAGLGQRVTIQNGQLVGNSNTRSSNTKNNVITYAQNTQNTQNTRVNSNPQNQFRQQGTRIVGNTRINESTNQVTRRVAEIDMENSRDYPLFDRLGNYYIRDYEETDFLVGTKVEGYKYRINYELKDGINAPTDKQVVRNHIRKVKSKGGRVLTNDGYASTMELKKGGKDLWIQVGSFGNGYEVIVVEKGNIRPAALRQGSIRKARTVAGLGQKVRIIGGKAQAVRAISNTLTSKQVLKTNSATRLSLIAKAIDTQGFIDASELTFDSKTATLQDKARANIADIAQMLKNNPTLSLIIIAHTNKGKSIIEDLSLSEQRANLIVKILSEEYGIANQRLEAKGLGSFAPVSSEATLLGRQANNRVVLMKK